MRKKKQCVLCGGSSPNTYGECWCSYEPVFFTGTWEEIAKFVGKRHQILMKHFIKGK